MNLLSFALFAPLRQMPAFTDGEMGESELDDRLANHDPLGDSG